jgi:hypothetical protein
MITRLKTLIWAEHSWMGAADLCELAMSLPHLKESKHLEHSIATGIIISYVRPFTKCNGLGKLGKEFREFKENESFQANHDRLIETRHKIFAHKDESWETELISDEKKYLIRIEEDGGFQTSMTGVVIDSFELIHQLIQFQKKRALTAKENLMQVYANQGIQAGNYIIGENFPPETQPVGI